MVEVGSHRSQTQVGHSDYYYPRRFDGKKQAGYYTQEEIREIVKYASDRFITVIPEIEMPGHASAALASYPELSCGLRKDYVVRDYFDVFDEVYCPKEHTFDFLENVLVEVMELFPSHYIHIGGDECPKKAWKKCIHCQTLMKKEGLPDEEALQSWFIHKIEQFVNSRGRDIIGWDEILEGGLAPNATVMSWRGEEGGIIAARQKHKVIIRYMETDKDHIHYMIETEPTMSISKIVNLMKSYTTYHIWKRYPDYLRKHFWKEHTFWTDGYFVCSVGNASEEMPRKYIENQG